jgi:hypothetical protein
VFSKKDRQTEAELNPQLQIPEIPIYGQTSIEVLPGKYRVTLEDQPFILFRFPFTLDHAGAGFIHANVLARFTETQEYKHYRANGSKFWSARPGVDLLMAVDKRLIRLVKEDGGTYPKLRIGNAQITTSVGGGGGSPWTDFISTKVTVCTNVKFATLQEIARLAMTPDQALKAGITVEQPPSNGSQFLANSLARMDSSKRLVAGNKIWLHDQYSFQHSQELEFVKWVNGQRMICTKDGMNAWVSLRRVNWVKTSAANNIPVRSPADLAYNGLEKVKA